MWLSSVLNCHIHRVSRFKRWIFQDKSVIYSPPSSEVPYFIAVETGLAKVWWLAQDPTAREWESWDTHAFATLVSTPCCSRWWLRIQYYHKVGVGALQAREMLQNIHSLVFYSYKLHIWKEKLWKQENEKFYSYKQKAYFYAASGEILFKITFVKAYWLNSYYMLEEIWDKFGESEILFSLLFAVVWLSGLWT